MRNPEKIRIVFLYTEVVGYVLGVIEELSSLDVGVSIDVIYRDKNKTSGYQLTEMEGVRFYPRSSLNIAGLVDLLKSRSPHIIYISGWTDKGYIKAVRRYKSANAKTQVVCGVDGQWKDTLRQKVGRIYFDLFYRQLFDFMWVSGKPQYHYAQRMGGYPHERIISNLYSADTRVFNRKAGFSKRFVFVGRFLICKGLIDLIDAYNGLPEEVKRDWPLVLIGDGEMREEIDKRKSQYVIVKPFMQPNELIEELSKGGVGCIPSHSEQWGVAIHEMAILGYPLILSSACGAATEFLVTGYNGYLYKNKDTRSLREALLMISALSEGQLVTYSLRSHELAKRIRTEHAAYSLLSVLTLSKLT